MSIIIILLFWVHIINLFEHFSVSTWWCHSYLYAWFCWDSNIVWSNSGNLWIWHQKQNKVVFLAHLFLSRIWMEVEKFKDNWLITIKINFIWRWESQGQMFSYNYCIWITRKLKYKKNFLQCQDGLCRMSHVTAMHVTFVDNQFVFVIEIVRAINGQFIKILSLYSKCCTSFICLKSWEYKQPFPKITWKRQEMKNKWPFTYCQFV